MEVPHHWRLKKQRYSLVGDVCPEGHANFPQDDVCKVCDTTVAVHNAVVANDQKILNEMENRKLKIIQEFRIQVAEGKLSPEECEKLVAEYSN